MLLAVLHLLGFLLLLELASDLCKKINLLDEKITLFIKLCLLCGQNKSVNTRVVQNKLLVLLLHIVFDMFQIKLSTQDKTFTKL